MTSNGLKLGESLCTVLFLIRWFLIRLANHSIDVASVSYLPGGSFDTASAIIGLSPDRGRKMAA